MSELNNIKNYIQKKLNFFNVAFSCTVSYLLTLVCLRIFRHFFIYDKLNDFYAGTTIYQNYNKHFDYFCFLIYLILFFAVLYFTNFKNIDINKYTDKVKDSSIFKAVINSGLILAITFAVMYILNFSVQISEMDNHHLGERFATYWLHMKYGMKYYSDLMLVHGYFDVIPSYIADKFLGKLNFYNVGCAAYLFTGIVLLINCLLAYFGCRFKKLTLFLAAGIGCLIAKYPFYYPIFTFFLTYILLLEHIDTKRKFLWNITYYILSFVSLTFYTTAGTACFIATLPLFVKRFRLDVKFNSVFWTVALSISGILFHESIIEYLHKAAYYATSNIYSFGNFFPKHFTPFSFLYITVMFLPLLLLPYFILKLYVADKKDDFKPTYIISYIIIAVLINFNYSFFRPDEEIYLHRLSTVSLPLLLICFPYLMRNNKAVQVLYSTCIFFVIMYTYLPHAYIQTGAKWSEPDLEYYKPISKYVNEKVPLNSTILDLNNNGMNYYYLQRKCAMPYVSFYNIVNSKQVHEILVNLKKTPPALVLLYDPQKIILHDKVTIPLRINEIYRWLFLSGLYKITKKDNSLYMEYSPKTYPNTVKQNLITDCNMISNIGNLYYLPDAWGNSLKNLPAEKVSDLTIKDNCELIPDNKISPKDAGLLYIELNNAVKKQKIELSMNNQKDTIKFKSSQKSLLIPVDIYPSWLLEKEIRSFKIQSNKPINLNKAELYKRKFTSDFKK